MGGGMDIGTILNLDSLCLTFRQAPKLPLDIILRHWDSTKHSMQLIIWWLGVGRTWTMFVPPVPCE